MYVNIEKANENYARYCHLKFEREKSHFAKDMKTFPSYDNFFVWLFDVNYGA